MDPDPPPAPPPSSPPALPDPAPTFDLPEDYWGAKHRPFARAWLDASDADSARLLAAEPPRGSADDPAALLQAMRQGEPLRRPLTIDELATALIRGASIAHAVTPNLRTLVETATKVAQGLGAAGIDALQQPFKSAHEAGVLRGVDPWRGWTLQVNDPTQWRRRPRIDDTPGDCFGCLALRGGVLQARDYSTLDVPWTLHASLYVHEAVSFVEASFGVDAWFDRASFDGDARFDRARFGGDAWFGGASFGKDAWFSAAHFGGDARFDEARFGEDAWFGAARFVGNARFDEARFDKDAEFDRARFGGDALFGVARFNGDALFDEARFGKDAWFGAARFGGDARFDEARFGEDAWFGRARFEKNAGFDRASFVKDVWFDEASFGKDAGFDRASFGGDAWFGGASFGKDAGFNRASFGATTVFALATFVERASFKEARLPPRAELLDTDWRRVDVRKLKLQSSRFAKAARALAAITDWRTVRAVGRLSFLSRVSVAALIVVPILAGAWPAIRVAVNGYNRALTSAAADFERTAEQLRDVSSRVGEPEALDPIITRFEASADDWLERFGEMTLDQPLLPISLAFAFFAAASITIGQLLYQMLCPRRVQQDDEETFVEWFIQRYESEEDRPDGLRRACDALESYARVNPRRHPNLVEHHGDMVWIPSKERTEWFKEAEFDQELEALGRKETAGESIPKEHWEAADEMATQRPPGYVGGEERKRIALEEGARAEYRREGRKSPGRAFTALAFYALGFALLALILIIQIDSVAKAAGIRLWFLGMP